MGIGGSNAVLPPMTNYIGLLLVPCYSGLNIKVQGKFPRVRPQADGVDLVLPLVLDPALDEVAREDVALEEPVVALLEVVEHDVERAGQLLDLLRLGRRQLVEVLVHRLARVDLVGDTV